MSPRPRGQKDRTERREDALRPSHYLGYDRDSLSVYLVSRGAYDIAESQLRRAIWLNPYEPRFKEHLAACLYKQGQYREARDWIQKALEQGDEENSRHVLHLIEHKLASGESEPGSGRGGPRGPEDDQPRAE